MKKRILSILLAALTLLGMISFSALTTLAADPAKITSVALTNAPESYTVGEELGALTSPVCAGEGIDIEGYMMVESDMNSFHFYAVTPMSPTSTFKADKYYYYVVMIDHIDGYASTDSTIYTINGKTAKAEWFAADENNCLLCVVPYDKTTGQLKNYDCPIAVPGGFTAIDSVDISGVPESFTPGNVIDVDLKGDSFTVSNPHAILETDRDWYVDWYKFDSDTFGFYEFLDSTSHAVVSNQTFSGDKYYYIRIILTADVENGYMFTENTTFTINGKTAAWSMYATAGLFAYVYAAVPKATTNYSAQVALNGYSLGANVADAYVSESSDTVELYDFNDDGTFFCIFEDDGTGCSDWSSVVTTFEANKDYWLVIALAKQGGDALPEAELDADKFTLINGCVDKYTVYDDDLWWVEFKLNRLSDAAPDVYTITFDANGGNVSPESATTGNDGKLASLPTPTHTSPSASFAGWYTGKTGTIQVTTDTVFTSNTTIYAQWSTAYFIDVTLNGYELGEAVADITFTENSDSVDIDTENCHIFTEKDGEPDWSSEVTEFEANKDYWLVVALTKQGGAELAESDLAASDVHLTNEYTEKQMVYDDGLWWVSYKLKPLANSVSTTYTVTFDSNGGSAVTTQTVESGKTASEPAAPAKEGYTFKGWTYKGSPYDFSKPVTGNITLYARWGTVYNIDTIPTLISGQSMSSDDLDAYFPSSSSYKYINSTPVWDWYDSDVPSGVAVAGTNYYAYAILYLEDYSAVPYEGDFVVKYSGTELSKINSTDIYKDNMQSGYRVYMYDTYNVALQVRVYLGTPNAAGTTYNIISGANGIYQKGSAADTLSFIADGNVADFLGVEVDGSLINVSDYNVESGSTIVELKKAYLESLIAGEHTIKIRYHDGEASTKFTVKDVVPTTYTVSFDANGGIGTMPPANGISGEYELPACTFTAPDGKQFKAWSVGGVEKNVGDKITVTADATVIAAWEDVPHSCKENLTKVEADPATCTDDGNIEYYECSCGKWFSDATASVEITDKDSVVIKGGHKYGELVQEEPAVHNATEQKNGMKAHYFCDECDTYFTADKVATTKEALVIANAHSHGAEWKSDEKDHWNECACGDKANSAPHGDENGDGKCDACDYTVGTPETGDDGVIAVWIIAASVSVLLCLVLFKKRKAF